MINEDIHELNEVVIKAKKINSYAGDNTFSQMVKPYIRIISAVLSLITLVLIIKNFFTKK